jgi:hypothetical protein
LDQVQEEALATRPLNFEACIDAFAFLTHKNIKTGETAKLLFDFKGTDILYPSHPAPKSFFRAGGTAVRQRIR